MFDSLKRAVQKARGGPLIVAGDLNEPRYTPLQNGRIVTWGEWWDSHQGRFITSSEIWRDRRGRRGTYKKWDTAVRWLFEPRNKHGLTHAYWERPHEPGAMAVSHLTHGGKRAEQARWFDHMFVSSDFRVAQCEYIHKLRGPGRSDHSDHSALSATLIFGPRAG
jgi:hypothetical protein